MNPIRHRLAGATLIAVLTALVGCDADQRLVGETATDSSAPSEPAWAADAVFYQIFPERFANGDTSNDPIRRSLEFPEVVPENWSLSPWTGDWYAREEWEEAIGSDFYENGVFHRRYGGDLQGVLDRLDYLKDLGINTIYFNPVFYARSLHKYDGNSFHHIDPYFGPDPQGDLELLAGEDALADEWAWTSADRMFVHLLSEAHRRDIRIIIDGVWNHSGRGFFAFQDLIDRQQESPYKDWYIVRSFDDPATPDNEFAYKGWWDVATLPEFANTEDGSDLHPDPKAYIFRATSRWMDPDGDGDPSDGIDGWRLDVTEEVPDKFWADWNRHVRTINPDAYTVCENWNEASEHIASGGFSATMNYHAFALPTKAFIIDESITAPEFMRLLDERRNRYPSNTQYAMQNLIESHDTDRLASMIVNAHTEYVDPPWFDFDRNVSPRGGGAYDVRKPTERERKIQRLVVLFQMTYVGAPMVYYGTEAGMWGADDPDDRMPMTWPEMQFDPQVAHPLGTLRQSDPVGFDQDIFDFYQSAIRIRHDQEALRRGSVRFVHADEDAKTVSYLRTTEDESVLVALNRSDTEQTLVLSLDADGFETAEIVFSTTSDSGVSVEIVNDGVRLTLPGLTGVVVAGDSN